MGAISMTAMHVAAASDQGIESRLLERSGAIRELDDIDGLVRKYSARILRFVTYSTNDADLAQSITQDTLLRAYNGRENFRGDCSVYTWLTGIAINVTRDHLRTEKYKFWKKVRTTAVDVHEMAGFISSREAGAEQRILAKERLEQLSKVLATLSYNQRTVFLMKFSEDMSVDEIGEALNMSFNTVRTHLHRALKAVRTQLGANSAEVKA